MYIYVVDHYAIRCEIFHRKKTIFGISMCMASDLKRFYITITYCKHYHHTKMKSQCCAT